MDETQIKLKSRGTTKARSWFRTEDLGLVPLWSVDYLPRSVVHFVFHKSNLRCAVELGLWLCSGLCGDIPWWWSLKYYVDSIFQIYLGILLGAAWTLENMAQTLSMREKYKTKHTMVCLLRAVIGRITTVELRNECSATGYVDDVDGFMNVTMSKVLFVNMDGDKMHMDSFFVQASLVRYVQIPDDINMVKAMKKQLMLMNPRKKHPGSMSGPRKKPPLKL